MPSAPDPEDAIMGDEQKSGSWWHSLPGVITGVAAIITAIAGLLAALTQTGWFGARTPPAVAGPSSSSAPLQPGSPSGWAQQAAAANTSGPQASSSTYAVALPSLRDYKLGPASTQATFTLLKAEVSPRTAEKSALQIRLRMTNHDRYDKNFWDQSFRFLVEGVPIAPDGGLNELVAGEAAKEGDVVFTIPRGTPSGKLKITYYDDATEIPLGLAAPR